MLSLILQYFPRNDRRLSFHVVNRWRLLEQSIHRKRDSDQDVAFCWRHFRASGKKEKTKSETWTGAVAHEEKRKRTFLPLWQKDRPWLIFMPEVTESQSTSETTTSGGKMFCEICETASQTDKTIAQNNVFVQSCSSFRVESVKIHESSANHVRATSFKMTNDLITILSLNLHSCLEDPNWNRASRLLGLLTQLTTQKKMNMDPCTTEV